MPQVSNFHNFELVFFITEIEEIIIKFSIVEEDNIQWGKEIKYSCDNQTCKLARIRFLNPVLNLVIIYKFSSLKHKQY